MKKWPLTAQGVQTNRPALRRSIPLALLIVVQAGHLSALSPGVPVGRAAATLASPVATPRKPEGLKSYGRLPLAFVPNDGQTDPRVRYVAQAGGASFWFTPTEAVFAFAGKPQGMALRLAFVGANHAVALEGREPGTGRVNYLRGSDHARWRRGIPTYHEVAYRELWPGIDMTVRGESGRLKYEFLVRPGARVDDIRLAYRGAERLALDPEGELQVETGLGTLTDQRPESYQLIDGQRVRVDSRYALGKGTSYGFKIGGYDRGQAVVIDPGLVYSTYLGGSGLDYGLGIAVDAGGSAYVTGLTESADFPTTAGAFDTTYNGGTQDVFVTKLDPTGSDLLYSTFLGGSDRDQGQAIAVDASGNAYVTGNTMSADFPTTTGAFDTSFNGFLDAFVTKLDPTGSNLLYSTYLGGRGGTHGEGIAVDVAGSAYVTGTTGADFPTTVGAFDTSPGGGVDAFVTKLDATGSGLVYSTYLGGSTVDEAFGIAVDTGGSAYVTGRTNSADFPTTAGAFETSSNGDFDAFVSKLDASGSALLYSTYLGGHAAGAYGDLGKSIAVDADGSAYVTGDTLSPDFPTTVGAFDTSFNGGVEAFVTKLDATGSALAYSTYLGGSVFEQGLGIAVDAGGNAYVTGQTGSVDFPTTPGAFEPCFNRSREAYVTKLDVSGMPVYSTYFGGSTSIEVAFGIAVDGAGNAYVTGFTASSDLPTTAGAFDTTFNGDRDVFVTKLSTTGAGVPVMVALSPAAGTNPVGTSHTVTATVTDTLGQPVADMVVRFSVTGSVVTSGSCTTDAAGQCGFTYPGPQLPGADLISAYADTNDDGVQDCGEPVGSATKDWVLPSSITGQATGAGHIADDLGHKIAFRFTAKSDGGTKGGCAVIDKAAGRTIKCVDVTALVTSGNEVTFYGRATDNGVATMYVIHAVDNGEPGKGRDIFSIHTASGYSREGVLTAGDVQVH